MKIKAPVEYIVIGKLTVQRRRWIKESIVSDKAALVESNEESIEETVLLTAECQDSYGKGEKSGFNNRVKVVLMIEDDALACLVEDDVDPDETDEEDEAFDPNEANDEDILPEDERIDMYGVTPRCVISWEFGTVVSDELDWPRTANDTVLIDIRTEIAWE